MTVRAGFYHQLIALVLDVCGLITADQTSPARERLTSFSAYTMTNACLMKTQSISSSLLRSHKPSQRIRLVSVLLGLDLEVVRVLVQRVLAGGDDGPEVWGLELDRGSARFTR